MSDDDDDGDADASEAHRGLGCRAWRAWRCSGGGAYGEGWDGIADGECEDVLWRWTTGGGWDVDEREASGGRGFVGANGVGKSTVFSVMVGRERSTGGSVFLGSMDITTLSLPHHARLGIGYMTQESSVFRGLSVHDNIRLILEATGAPRARRAHRVQELIDEISLQAVENTMGRALSGGPPKILLVDKPFAGVDPIGVAEIQKIVCDEEELGVLITDHSVNDVSRL